MKFILDKDSWNNPVITVDTLRNKKDVTAIRFQSLISVLGLIADDIIGSFYTLLDKHPKRPYITPSKYSEQYNTIISSDDEDEEAQLQHFICPGRESFFISILSNVEKDGITESKPIESKSTLYQTLLRFMQMNKEKITFPSTEDREECRLLFADEFVLPKEINDLKFVKKTIESELGAYQKMGKKFTLFTKNSDRNLIIEALVRAIKPLTDKKILDETDYKEIVKQLVLAKNKTLDSHKRGSTFGALGITSSRLAQSLNNCINEFGSRGFITRDFVNETYELIENAPKILG